MSRHASARWVGLDSQPLWTRAANGRWLRENDTLRPMGGLPSSKFLRPAWTGSCLSQRRAIRSFQRSVNEASGPNAACRPRPCLPNRPGPALPRPKKSSRNGRPHRSRWGGIFSRRTLAGLQAFGAVSMENGGWATMDDERTFAGFNPRSCSSSRDEIRADSKMTGRPLPGWVPPPTR